MWTRIALIVIYPWLIGTRWLRLWRHRDELALREPEGTCWVERTPPSTAAAYFHDGMLGGERGSVARMLIRLSSAFHRSGASSRITSGDDIPDEIYTLW